MKLARYFAALLTLGSTLAFAQAAPAAPSAEDAKNPVTATIRRIFERQRGNLTAAAEQMPADKYGFKPTEPQETFAHVVAHVVTSNAGNCERIGDAPAPAGLKDVKDSDGKEKLVAALKQSFDFCGDALKKVDDTRLADQVQGGGSNKVARAALLINLATGYADHYAQSAMYLRLNGMLPPTAQPRK
jgi:uncharacterized damage-inducible protein DinB